MDAEAEGSRTARVSVAVMAHPSRREWAVNLSERLDCRVVWDRRNNVWDTASRAWAAFDRQATHHAVIQDDAVVADHLREALPGIVAWRPRSLISLLTIEVKLKPPDLARYRQTLADGGRWFWAHNGLPGCALIMPVGDIPSMIAAGSGMSTPHDDQKIMSYFRSQRRFAWFTVPSLAQHRNQDENPSLVNPNRGWRPRQAGAFVGEDFDARTLDFTPRDVPAEVEFDPVPPRAYRNKQTGRVVVAYDASQQAQMARARRWVETGMPPLPS